MVEVLLPLLKRLLVALLIVAIFLVGCVWVVTLDVFVSCCFDCLRLGRLLRVYCDVWLMFSYLLYV